MKVRPPDGHCRPLPGLVPQPALRAGQWSQGPEDRGVGREAGQELSHHSGLQQHQHKAGIGCLQVTSESFKTIFPPRNISLQSCQLVAI